MANHHFEIAAFDAAAFSNLGYELELDLGSANPYLQIQLVACTGETSCGTEGRQASGRSECDGQRRPLQKTNDDRRDWGNKRYPCPLSLLSYIRLCIGDQVVANLSLLGARLRFALLYFFSAFLAWRLFCN